MALTKCKECGQQVSTTAKTRPNCGAKVKKPTSIFKAIAVIGTGFVALTVIGGIFAPTAKQSVEAPKPTVPKPKEPEPPTPADALFMAEKFVTNSLKSPSTASFGSQLSRDTVTQFSDGSFIVRLWVDSQNGFGATVRSDFEVKLRRIENGRWVLVEPLKAQQP